MGLTVRKLLDGLGHDMRNNRTVIYKTEDGTEHRIHYTPNGILHRYYDSNGNVSLDGVIEIDAVFYTSPTVRFYDQLSRLT